MITSDAKTLELWLSPGAGMNGTPALVFDGKALFAPEAGSQGYGGTLSVRSADRYGIEILAPGQGPASSTTRVAIYADQLNAFGAARMTIGGGMTIGGAVGGSTISFGLKAASDVTPRSGAVLSAAEVFLIASRSGSRGEGSITVEQGATINTLGRGAVPPNSFVTQASVRSKISTR